MPPVPTHIAGTSTSAPWAIRRRLGRAQRGVLAAVLTSAALVVAGCGSGHPRTEVLRSTSPITSDIYLRITGPGGAAYYVAQRFSAGDAFSRFRFHETAGSDGVFLPPTLRERKLCSATHRIRSGDALQLQKWRGRTLAITIYGRRVSRIYCAVLTGGLYLGPS
jgi:hypothetical protein